MPPIHDGADVQRRVTAACALMNEAGGPLPVGDLAVDVSTRQLQRDFVEVLGISPRAYGQAVRTAAARKSLRSKASVLDAVFDAGHGSVRSFYDGAARRLGMSPAQYRAGAPGQDLVWSACSSSVGEIVAAATDRGLAAARICPVADARDELAREFPRARLVRDDRAMREVMGALAALAAGSGAGTIPVDVEATAFQARVWAALREIPAGQTRTYAQIAQDLGDARAVRAVARACATNPVALAIPCHRVIRADGSLAGYRWGLQVKEQLLAVEAGR